MSLARLDSIGVLESGNEKPEAAVALVGELELLIPLAGLIDKEAELARLARETAKLQQQIDRLASKLANTGFTDKAPPAVVAGEQAKLDEARVALSQLREQQTRISNLT